MADTWDPQQYERFKAERSKPFYDLLALVLPAKEMRIVDLGCGTGELTAELHRRLGARETVGIDSSAAMLERAAGHVVPGLRFEHGDLSHWQLPFAPSLVFSNAAFQWVGDHPALFARLAAALPEGGQLAVQMPANFDYPSHVVARELEAEEPFRSRLAGETRTRMPLGPDEYATLLDDLGFREQVVRIHVYPHHLAGREDVIEWVKGTLLTQYESLLGADLYADFLRRYRAELLPRLRDRRPFFYPFKRLLAWGRR